MESEDYIRGWLRGFYDGEGWATFHFSVRKSGKYIGRKTRTIDVCVGNTDAALMETCCRYLRAVGIEPRKVQTFTYKAGSPNKPFHRLHIANRRHILVFAEKVGFTAPEKVAKLEAIVRWFNRPSANLKANNYR